MEPMLRFIHTADIHFGMENYGKIDSKTGIHTRLLDFQNAFNICIDRAIAEDVDFFLFAGDAYKTATPSPTQQKLFIECLLRLFKANIPIVMILGNHDHPMSFGKTHALDLFSQFPVEGFHVIAKPQTIVIQTKRGPVQIVGIPWPTRSSVALNAMAGDSSPDEVSSYISRAITKIIEHQAQQLNPELPAILAAHLTVGSALFSGSEKRAITGRDPIFLPSQLAIPPFDYVGLGHLHRYQNLNEGGHPAIVYSGSLERIDFGERHEEKGFCLVTIHNKTTTTHEFIKVPIRQFLQIDINLHENKGQTDQIIDAVKKHNLHDAIVKIVYRLPANALDKVDTRAVQNVCENALHVIGIFPVHQLVTREQRVAVHEDMSLETVLKLYFASKQMPTQRIEQLVQKTLLLEEQTKN
jgi:exonuclease SbcD